MFLFDWGATGGQTIRPAVYLNNAFVRGQTGMIEPFWCKDKLRLRNNIIQSLILSKRGNPIFGENNDPKVQYDSDYNCFYWDPENNLKTFSRVEGKDDKPLIHGLAEWKTSTGLDLHSIEGDPGYPLSKLMGFGKGGNVDMNTPLRIEDLILPENSPCRRAGMNGEDIGPRWSKFLEALKGMKVKKVKVAVTAAKLDEKGFPPYFYFYANPRKFDRKANAAATEVHIAHLLELYDEAGKQGARLVASYENVTEVHSLPEFMDRVETIPGPTTDRFATVARRHRLHAQVNLYERSGGKVYNTSVLLGPKGEIAGKYRKVHLPPQERRDTTPGDGFPVCETEIGNIGFSICYDIMFPETARGAALNGADILIQSGNTSYTCRDCYTRVRAAENMLWHLVCNIQDARMSEIIDPHGTVVARQGRTELLIAEINPKLERDMPKDNRWAGCRSLRGRMTQERVPDAYAVLCASNPPLLKRYRNDRIPSKASEYKRTYDKARKEVARIYRAELARRRT